MMSKALFEKYLSTLEGDEIAFSLNWYNSKGEVFTLSSIGTTEYTDVYMVLGNYLMTTLHSKGMITENELRRFREKIDD